VDITIQYFTQVNLGQFNLLPLLSKLTKLIINLFKPAAPLAVEALKRKSSVTSTSVQSVGIASQSNTAYGQGRGSVLIEKLPSFIQVPNQLTEASLHMIPKYILQQFVFSPLLLKELCLQNTVDKLLDCIPQPWRKVSTLIYKY